MVDYHRNAVDDAESTGSQLCLVFIASRSFIGISIKVGEISTYGGFMN